MPGRDHRCTLRRLATASGGRAQAGRDGGSARVSTSLAGKPSRTDRSPKRSRCLTQAPARTSESAPTALPSHTIAPGSTTLPRPMWQPWIIAPGPITASSSMISSLSGADDRGAVTENGALTYPDRMLGRANRHPVLQDRRVVADAHRCPVRPHDQALRQYRAGPDMYLTQNDCGAGDLGPGVVNEQLVEAHGGLTVLLAVRAPGGPIRTLLAPLRLPLRPAMAGAACSRALQLLAQVAVAAVRALPPSAGLTTVLLSHSTSYWVPSARVQHCPTPRNSRPRELPCAGVPDVDQGP